MPLKFVRTWLPAALVVAGLGVVLAGGAKESALEIGVPLFAAGASVWLLNAFFRLGVSGDLERDEEDAARAYFQEHGRWPDDRA